jgi:YtcA family/Prokaryotic membrane lipoprotein lipid attachment site
VKRTFLTILAMLSLAGCTRAPSVDIVGSFFPAWLLCFTIAVVFTVFVSLLLSRFRLSVAYPVLFYPSLAALLTFALWLVFFY